jgi:hypothetical protein
MVRTQIQLTEEQAEAVKRLAAQEGRSMADFIRASVDRQLLRSVGVTEAERRRRALAAVGRFRAGASDIAEDHDAALDQAFDPG